MATTPTYLLPFAALCGMFSCTAAFIKINTTTPGKTSVLNCYAEGRGKIITGQDAMPVHLFKNN